MSLELYFQDEDYGNPHCSETLDGEHVVSYGLYTYNFQKILTICKRCHNGIPQYTTVCHPLLFTPPVYHIYDYEAKIAKLVEEQNLNEDLYFVLVLSTFDANTTIIGFGK